ncbi:hypothetical protein L593_07230 [Salinarchaeum sp. Harcht-Bsk1]|uniref:hypothetical protein n=1 Tax=Salinarchaeum sp. Harcht-Bsk1 TaxID=1333523 RepID=UPI0003422DF5|nr:hypothetical protein [Salinarchaeum sp. Harcht-Bsk1]AGN01393.1 hypothetical protein L593_07230 [Salinarchaeum sp. Harcht-Bsk1]
MGGKQTEACGRCSVTAVLDAKEAVDDEDAESGGQNPFDGERIELGERELTSVVRHEVAAGKLKSKLDAFATRVIYGR